MDITKKMEMIRKTSVLSFSDYLNEDNGFQIRMEDFDAELASAYKDSTGQDMTSTLANSSNSDNVKVKNNGGAAAGEGGGAIDKNSLDEFTEKCRKTYPKTNYVLNTSDLLDKSGSLKSKYSKGFINAWKSSLDAGNQFGYFFYSGGLYEPDSPKTSLLTPCNWPKWVTLNSGLSGENINAFITNYESTYVSGFAKLPKNSKNKCIDLLVKANSLSDMSYENTMGRLKQYVDEFKDSSFISYPALKRIKDDLNQILNDDDWGFTEFVVFNNIMVILANTVSFNDGKIISGFRWIYENSNILVEARRIVSDKIMSDGDSYVPDALVIKRTDNGPYYVVNISKSGINDFGYVKLDSKTNDAFSKITSLTTSNQNEIKGIIARNLYYIVNDIYNSLHDHIRRMNANEFSNIPQTPNLKTFDSGK